MMCLSWCFSSAIAIAGNVKCGDLPEGPVGSNIQIRIAPYHFQPKSPKSNPYYGLGLFI